MSTTPTSPPSGRAIVRKRREIRAESAARIKALRTAHGMSQPEFAQYLTNRAIGARLGIVVSLWTLVHWEQARRLPAPPWQALLDQIAREVAERDHGGSVPGLDPERA